MGHGRGLLILCSGSCSVLVHSVALVSSMGVPSCTFLSDAGLGLEPAVRTVPAEKNVVMNNSGLRLEWQITLPCNTLKELLLRATEGRKCERRRGDVNTAKLYYLCLLLSSHLVKLTTVARLFCVTRM